MAMFCLTILYNVRGLKARAGLVSGRWCSSSNRARNEIRDLENVPTRGENSFERMCAGRLPERETAVQTDVLESITYMAEECVDMMTGVRT